MRLGVIQTETVPEIEAPADTTKADLMKMFFMPVETIPANSNERICLNCKFYKEIWCKNPDLRAYDANDSSVWIEVEDTFGCIQMEPK